MELLDKYLSFKTLQSFPIFDADENGRQIIQRLFQYYAYSNVRVKYTQKLIYGLG